MKSFNEIIKEISRDDVINYYWEQNHTYKECCEHFDIGGGVFARLLKYFDAKKPNNLHSENIKKAKLEKYGDENYNNREKSKQTCLEKYGVDNVFKDTDKIKSSYVEKLGVQYPMELDWVKQKVVSNRDYVEIMKKAKNTYFEKTGYENPFSNPEVIQKWKETQRNNGCFDVAGSSNMERRLEKILIRKYGEVLTHYVDDRYAREDGYKFECDFYVPSEDLFIELNGHYTHKKEPFDCNNEQHLKLSEQLKTSNKKWEVDTYKTWCERDVSKLEVAKTAGLNYIVLYPANTIFENQKFNDKKHSKLISYLLKKLNNKK